MSEKSFPVSRLHIITDFTPSCCGGAPFLADNDIDQTPYVLRNQISDAEWSDAMRQLQSITMKGTPSMCTQISLVACFGVLSLLCLNARVSSLSRRLSRAIQDLNTNLFSPRGLYMSLKRMDASCCNPGKIYLVIALTPEESNILQQEKFGF